MDMDMDMDMDMVMDDETLRSMEEGLNNIVEEYLAPGQGQCAVHQSIALIPFNQQNQITYQQSYPSSTTCTWASFFNQQNQITYQQSYLSVFEVLTFPSPSLVSFSDPEAPLPTHTPQTNKKIISQVNSLSQNLSFHSFFITVIFLGFTYNVSTHRSLADNEKCDVDLEFGRDLLRFQVVAFTLSAFSLLLSLALGRFLTTFKEEDSEEVLRIRTKSKYIHATMLVSVLSSLIGSVFLLICVIYTYQVKAGKLSCQPVKVIVAIVFLCLMLGAGFILNAVSEIHAFWYNPNPKSD